MIWNLKLWGLLLACDTKKDSAAAAAEFLQLCLTPCGPIDGSPPGSSVPGILQARTLEWAAISFSSAWKWKVKVKSLSLVWPCQTPLTAAYQAPLSMGFSRQGYWSAVSLPSPKKDSRAYLNVELQLELCHQPENIPSTKYLLNRPST